MTIALIPKQPTCDLCHGPVGKFIVDGATVMGPWASMCVSCHAMYGRGFGTGLGQKFDTETGRKVEG